MSIQQTVLAAGDLLEESRVLGWAIQVLDTLAYLHELPKPIIHRDVKPENLILAQDGRVMLIDFGLMKQVERQLEASRPLIRAVGTVEYAPPEQYADSGATTDARSDMYSLGATLFYLLAGELPPKAIDRLIPVSVGISRQIPTLQRHNPTVSGQFERVIRKALEIDPENRFQTARQMRAALAPRQRFINLPF
jgi:serine/threonine-protein kinase